MQNSSVEDTKNQNKSIKINGILIDFKIPKIMGILNLTDDSFYEKSRLNTDKELLKRVGKQLSEGADILDVGAFSTRPNANIIEEKVERKKIANSIKSIKKAFPESLISVDTFRGSVAQAAIDEGASIVNDISGFQFDESIIDVVAQNKVAYILMHINPTFETMHKTVTVSDQKITEKVMNYFKQKKTFLAEKGVDSVILDPGFGFSKTMAENYELLHHLQDLQKLKCPVLVGVSRKSMIYKKLGIHPDEALNGTTVLNTVALMKGASILRVHDVKECKQIINLLVSNEGVNFTTK